MNTKQATVFYTAFSRRLQELSKAAAMTKQAVSGVGPAVEAAEAVGKKLAPGLFGQFRGAFRTGAENATKGIFRRMSPELPGMAAGGGFVRRLGYGLGQSRPGMWAYQNPDTAGALGAGVGGMVGLKGYDAHQNAMRERMMAEAPFGTRLQMALSYLMSPENTAHRMMG
jgi:hypothetical protein